MSTAEQSVPPLFDGQRLKRDEFLRRGEASPRFKLAELLGGVVVLGKSVTLEHGEMVCCLAGWSAMYSACTVGCRGGVNAKWLMQEDAPEPDLHMRILPEFGGQSRVQGLYGAGAPELIAEVSESRSGDDLRAKLELYQSSGVVEYIVVLLQERQVLWHRLAQGGYKRQPEPLDGVYRSTIFPGLWLHPHALIEGNKAQILATLNQGLATPEHAAFVAQLAARRS